jgi:uncharacterized protein
MPNRLANENSPYLLQHANNPVDWFPWGQEALEKSKKENKPIFLSIGYAACHWCHVMEHESFEDESTAAFMNEHFVNIKVDREERPDLDSIYMNATQAMTGSGGWPMSVFLTPDLQPFYAGTYFPPIRRYNMPAFREVLQALANFWQNEPEKALTSAQRVTDHIRAVGSVSQYELDLKPDHLKAAVRTLVEGYDWGYGGWGDAPKFPQPMAIEFLLRRHVAGNEEALRPAVHALDAMARGGMYDAVGGGFSRYSTDNFWRVPHFEKMLYDNALLARAYLHAWQITANPDYKRIVEETLEFIAREMTHSSGGFYSSLDADSEGEEGKFYVWTAAEIKHVLGDDYEFFQAAYGISEQGNWEGKVVLQRALDDASLASRFNLERETVTARLSESHARLLAARSERVRPGTDDKVLASWNGLMLTALAEAARAFEGTQKGEQYLMMATRNGDFLLTSLYSDGRLRRLWRENRTTDEVFLEDYAALILGLLELYQTDFNNRWFAAALELADQMIMLFSDPGSGFFDTPEDAQSLVLRPKDMQDNAIPSGNSMACEALLRLGALTDRGDYRDRAEAQLKFVGEAAIRYPTAFARWLSAADFAVGQVKQVAVLGEAEDETFKALIKTVRSEYRPNVVVAASPFPPAEAAPHLLKDRPLLDEKPTAYVCEGFVCRQPVTDAGALQNQL